VKSSGFASSFMKLNNSLKFFEIPRINGYLKIKYPLPHWCELFGLAIRERLEQLGDELLV